MIAPTPRVEHITLFAPAPAGVQQALVTIDGRDPETDLFALEEICRWQLNLIMVAATEQRLMLQKRRHKVTGDVGLLVCESWRHGEASPSALIAELLGIPRGTWAEQTQCMDYLTILARRRELSLVTHGTGTHHVTFVVSSVESADGHLTWSYVARLLLTDGELAQWSQS